MRCWRSNHGQCLLLLLGRGERRRRLWRRYHACREAHTTTYGQAPDLVSEDATANTECGHTQGMCGLWGMQRPMPEPRACSSHPDQPAPAAALPVYPPPHQLTALAEGLQHWVDVLKGAVDVLALLGARQHHLRPGRGGVHMRTLTRQLRSNLGALLS